jgi:hypothetical protein
VGQRHWELKKLNIKQKTLLTLHVHHTALSKLKQGQISEMRWNVNAHFVRGGRVLGTKYN